MANQQLLTVIFGILGNVVSVLVYLAPAPTFYRIYKKKSTESFQSLPYQVALFSCMVWLHYALLKQDALLLLTINSFGCIAEAAYIALYFAYAPKGKKISAAKLFVGMNVVVFSGILLLTRFLIKDVKSRSMVLGWICVAVSACVFAAPLNVLARVIRTRSVEFMPFTLSFFLTLGAVLWFAYGVLQIDKFVAIPNIIGFFLGTVQMVLYAIYRYCSEKSATESSGNPTKELKTVVVLDEVNTSEVLSVNNVSAECENGNAKVDDQQTRVSLSHSSLV